MTEGPTVHPPQLTWLEIKQAKKRAIGSNYHTSVISNVSGYCVEKHKLIRTDVSVRRGDSSSSRRCAILQLIITAENKKKETLEAFPSISQPQLCDRIKLTPWWDLVASPGTKHSSQGGSSPRSLHVLQQPTSPPGDWDRYCCLCVFKDLNVGVRGYVEEVDSMDHTRLGLLYCSVKYCSSTICFCCGCCGVVLWVSLHDVCV